MLIVYVAYFIGDKRPVIVAATTYRQALIELTDLLDQTDDYKPYPGEDADTDELWDWLEYQVGTFDCVPIQVTTEV